MPTLTPPVPPTRAPHADPDMDALLDMLEERAVDPPSVRARARSIAVAATPRVAAGARSLAAADRRVARAASVAALVALVSFMAALVRAAEATARAVAAWDVRGRARRWGAPARVWADRVLAWPARLDQERAAGPRGARPPWEPA